MVSPQSYVSLNLLSVQRDMAKVLIGYGRREVSVLPDCRTLTECQASPPIVLC